MGRLLLACLAAGAASGCIDWDSLYDQQSDGGGGALDAAPDRDAPQSPVGCSDGSAEVLVAESGLAACSGAWSIPGIVLESEPACGRSAGNDGQNSNGEGCAAADLCAEGWHVCRDAADVSQHGGEEACSQLRPPDPEGGEFIYLTRQRGSGDEPTCAPDGGEESANDAWGCGTLGIEATDCKPLDRHLGLVADGGCPEPYSCGDDPQAEGQNIIKREPELGGGVLCCSGPSL